MIDQTEIHHFGGFPFLIRPNTTDWNTVNAAGPEDEYCLFRGTDLKGKLLFDVGSHIGTVSIFAAHNGARCVAVEPVPDNAELIRRNVLLNGLQEMVVVVEGAVGADTVRYDFGGDEFARHHAWIGNSFRGGHNPPPPPEVTYTEHPVREYSLSDLARQYGHPDIVKLDCEGGEWQALRDPLVDSVELIVGEWHPVGRGDESQGLVRYLLMGHHVDFDGPENGPGGFRAELQG